MAKPRAHTSRYRTIKNTAKRLTSLQVVNLVRRWRGAPSASQNLLLHDLNARRLIANGLSAERLAKLGYSLKDLRALGYSATDVRLAGFSAAKVIQAGYSPVEVANLNLSTASVLVGHPLGPLPENTDGASRLKKRLRANRTDPRLMPWTPDELVRAGAPPELVDGKTLARLLRNHAEKWAAIKVAMEKYRGERTNEAVDAFSLTLIEQLKGVFPPNKIISEFRDRPLILHKARYTARQMRTTGVPAINMRKAGFLPNELKKAGYSQTEIESAFAKKPRK